MSKQGRNWDWACDYCGKSGHVRLSGRVDVWSGCQAMLQAHHAASPECQHGRDRVRVTINAKRTQRKAESQSRQAHW